MSDKKNLWILTEEKPKVEVIAEILYKFSKDNETPCFIDTIRILPILNKDRRFSFLYEVIGLKSNSINRVFVKIISGPSSFVDFLVFFQDDEPRENAAPLYAIEETKTDDSESRNTGAYQRISKFVYLDHYYPQAHKIMLYNLQIPQKSAPTATYIFGTRCLMTLGVEIMGKKLDPKIFVPFESVGEVIGLKGKMRHAPAGNVPIQITKQDGKIMISGRLYKSGGLAHDPNIGALSAICATLRKLNWRGDITITNHGLKQEHLTSGNKFIKIAKILDIKIDGLVLPKTEYESMYWKYEREGEKLGTIFIHLVVENFTYGKSIFDNHAHSGKGYFITEKGEPIPLAKYSDRKAYKAGDKSKIINIPDLILIDLNRSEIINVEGKKYQFRAQAIEELKDYDAVEHLYINKHYPKYKIIRTVVLTGGNEKKVVELEVGFLLNENGDLILGIKPPELFKEAIKNLISFWYKQK